MTLSSRVGVERDRHCIVTADLNAQGVSAPLTACCGCLYRHDAHHDVECSSLQQAACLPLRCSTCAATGANMISLGLKRTLPGAAVRISVATDVPSLQLVSSRGKAGASCCRPEGALQVAHVYVMFAEQHCWQVCARSKAQAFFNMCFM